MNKIQIKHRADLWFGRYDHCIRVFLHEAPCLRDVSKSRAQIDKIIQRRKDWGRRMAATSGQPGSWYWQNLDITDQDRDNILAMLDLLQAATVDYRKVISGDWMYFYSTDPAFIDRIETLPFLQQDRIQRSRIELAGTPGTVRLQDVEHRYRSYFRGYMRLTDQQETALARYLANLDGVRLSPSLEYWVKDASPKVYIGDYFFIDHDDMGLLTMLSIIVPRLIRRTKPIESAK